METNNPAFNQLKVRSATPSKKKYKTIIAAMASQHPDELI